MTSRRAFFDDEAHDFPAHERFVSELCFGAMTFRGTDGPWGQVGKLGQEDADALVGAALDAGVNLFDTANVYAHGRSEEILGLSSAITSSDRSWTVGFLFTHATTSTRGATHRVLLWHEPSESPRADAEKATTPRPNPREDQEPPDQCATHDFSV